MLHASWVNTGFKNVIQFSRLISKYCPTGCYCLAISLGVRFHKYETLFPHQPQTHPLLHRKSRRINFSFLQCTGELLHRE